MKMVHGLIRTHKSHGSFCHQVTVVTGARLSATYHTPQHLHRLKPDDWNQLRECGFPVERAWKQGLPLVDHCSDQEEDTFPSSLTNIRQTSQASEVETYGCTVEDIDADHNLFLQPALQAICWLADTILSTDGQLQMEVASKPLAIFGKIPKEIPQGEV